MISFCSYLVTIGEDIGKVKNFFRILVLGELWLYDKLLCM